MIDLNLDFSEGLSSMSKKHDASDGKTDITEEINKALKFSSLEERELFAKLIETNDSEAFEEELAKIYNIKEAKEEEQPDYSGEVELETVKAVAYHFNRAGSNLKQETEEVEAEILGKEVKPKLSKSDANKLVKSSNPYIRWMVASKGMCPEILKNDPVSYIRAEVLKTTGFYSEMYKEKEQSSIVIRELIRQGIDHEHYRSSSHEYAILVEAQERADYLIELIENGSEKEYQEFLALLNDNPSVMQDYPSVRLHTSIIFESKQQRLNKKNAQEVVFEKDKDIQDSFVLKKVKVDDETPIGKVIAVKEGSLIIRGFNGEDADHDPRDLYEFFSQENNLNR